MTTISSSSGMQNAVQSGLQQLRLQQAKRNADQAEQMARALQVEAAAAQQVAVRAQENAQSLTVKSGQAEATAGQARQGLAMIKTAGQMQAQLGVTASTVVKQQSSQSSTTLDAAVQTSASSATPVVNTQGQLTGTLVNVTA